MTIHHITTTSNDTLHANQAGDTWIVENAGSIVTPSTGIDAGGGAANRTVIVKGEVYGLNYGIEFGKLNGAGGGEIVIQKNGLVHSDDTAILSRGNGQDITNHGTINGVEGIYSRGKGALITNTGTLDVSNSGIAIENGTAKIVNTGTIIAEGAIWAPSYDGGGSSHVVVFNSGSITGSKVGIELVSAGQHEIHNTGIVSGDIFFADGNDLLENTGAGKLKDGEIDMNGGKDTFVNTGRLLVNIAMGDNNDTADLRGGQGSGVVVGGNGNDVFYVDQQNVKLLEEAFQGTDTIRTTVNFSLSAGSFGDIEKLVAIGTKNIKLTGDDFDNRLIGNTGNNRLDGLSGDDVLVGGQGADVFIFGSNHKADIVVDFENGVDRIDVSDWAGIVNFQDIKQHLTVDGKDLVIAMGADELTLLDVKKIELNAGDFLFAA